MIKKTMIFTFCLGLFYNLSLIFYPVNISIGQHQWQDNCIKAQEYLFQKKKYNSVIVGSSMSTRIQTNSLHERFYNLSFGGLSVYDGLNVLEDIDILPDTLFVEMNILFRMPDENFKMSQKNRFFFNIRKHILIFQEKYQPSVYIGNYFTEFLGHSIIDPFSAFLFNPVISKLQKILFVKKNSSNNTLNTKLYTSLIDDYNNAKNIALTRQMLPTLFRYIEHFEKRGVKVSFFEMPMYEAIQNSAQMNFVRNSLKEKYIDSKNILIIPSPEYKDYTTTDGVHLDVASSKKFSKLFLSL